MEKVDDAHQTTLLALNQLLAPVRHTFSVPDMALSATCARLLDSSIFNKMLRFTSRFRSTTVCLSLGFFRSDPTMPTRCRIDGCTVLTGSKILNVGSVQQ